jgi:hypothetical protein
VVLFQQRFWAGIADGSITKTFRRWKRRQVVAGHRYRTAGGIVEVHAVDVVGEVDVTDEDARCAGYLSAAALLADLRGERGDAIYRIAFAVVNEPDPRAELAARDALSADDVAVIDGRLDRLDRASSHGPWTAAVLAAIATQPAVRAGDLAQQFGRERLAFKTDVRKLKNLGLTLSLDVGYRVSPRGEEYLRRTRRG